MASFLELQTAVRGNIIDLPTFVDDAVPALVNRAYRKAQSKHNFWIMRSQFDATTVVDTRTLGTRPANWKEWRGKPYWTEEVGSVRRIVLTGLDDARRLWDDDDTGEPEGIAEALPSDDAGAVVLNVYPLPDGTSDYPDGEYRVSVPYWKYLPELTGDADTSWLLNEGEAYLEAMATQYGFSKDWDEGRARYWQQEAAREWADLMLRDKYLQLSQMETLSIQTGPYEATYE